jgi:hypothetical protein
LLQINGAWLLGLATLDCFYMGKAKEMSQKVRKSALNLICRAELLCEQRLPGFAKPFWSRRPQSFVDVPMLSFGDKDLYLTGFEIPDSILVYKHSVDQIQRTL